MGPGMMGGHGGYGPGSGRMGGYGMGPGMMGGGNGAYGMGPGMMGDDGAYGMGPGMMTNGYGMGPIRRLDLTDAQRAKINSFADGLRRQHWAIMGKILDDEAKLRDLTSTAEPDSKAVGAQYADISKLRQEMLEAHVNAMNQARAVLTKDQRDQLDRWRRAGWGMGGSGADPDGQSP